MRWPETISLIVCSRTFWSFEQAANRERFAAVQNESLPQRAEAAWPRPVVAFIAACKLFSVVQNVSAAIGHKLSLWVAFGTPNSKPKTFF